MTATKIGDITWLCGKHYTNRIIIIPFIKNKNTLQDLSTGTQYKDYYSDTLNRKVSGMETLCKSYGIVKAKKLSTTKLMQLSLNLGYEHCTAYLNDSNFINSCANGLIIDDFINHFSDVYAYNLNIHTKQF